MKKYAIHRTAIVVRAGSPARVADKMHHHPSTRRCGAGRVRQRTAGAHTPLLLFSPHCSSPTRAVSSTRAAAKYTIPPLPVSPLRYVPPPLLTPRGAPARTSTPAASLCPSRAQCATWPSWGVGFRCGAHELATWAWPRRMTVDRHIHCHEWAGLNQVADIYTLSAIAGGARGMHVLDATSHRSHPRARPAPQDGLASARTYRAIQGQQSIATHVGASSNPFLGSLSSLDARFRPSLRHPCRALCL